MGHSRLGLQGSPAARCLLRPESAWQLTVQYDITALSGVSPHFTHAGDVMGAAALVMTTLAGSTSLISAVPVRDGDRVALQHVAKGHLRNDAPHQRKVLFNYPVCLSDQARRNLQTKLFGRLQVDD